MKQKALHIGKSYVILKDHAKKHKNNKQMDT